LGGEESGSALVGIESPLSSERRSNDLSAAGIDTESVLIASIAEFASFWQRHCWGRRL
jgi:hypothetical protein